MGALATLILFTGVFIVMGIALLSGRGTSLLNLPNRERYDVVAVGKFVGKCLFGYAVGFGLLLVGVHYLPGYYLEVCGAVLILIISVFMLVSIFTGKRFLKEKKTHFQNNNCST